MKVETTSEKVLEASKRCPQSKQTLEILFPEVFEEKNVPVFQGQFLKFANEEGFFQ
jgi:hypothetical protein